MNSDSKRNLPSRQSASTDSSGNLINYPNNVYPEELLEPTGGLDLKEFISVLSRRKKLIFTTVILTTLLALLITLLMQPVYRATSTIKVERYATNSNMDILDNQVSRTDRDFFETQIHLIQTKALAKRVIKELGIDKNKVPEGLIAKIKKVFSADTKDAGNDDLETQFLKNLTVKPVSNSQLLTISYDAPDPKMAATISNAIAKTFVRQNLERRFNTATDYKSYITENINVSRKNLEDAEARLNAYAQEQGIVQNIDGQSTASHTLKKQAEELVQAEKERIEAEAAYNIYQKDPSKDASSTITDPYILSLKKGAARLENKYQKLRNKRTRTARNLRKQIDAMLADIKSESNAIKSSLETKYLEALQKEQMLRKQLNETKKTALNVQTKNTKYNRLQREVEINQVAYDKQLEQLMAVNMASNVGTNNIAIIDQATPPTKKYKPSLKTNLLFGGLLGLLLGMGLAFLREFVDDSIKDTGALEKLTGLPVLSQLPDVKHISPRKLALQTTLEPRSPLAEAIRSLRTSLRFSTRNGSPKTTFVTSAGPGEGKSTVAVNLATAYAQAGANVLLIDADLRNPSIHKLFEIENMQGLTNYLASDYLNNDDISHPCMVKNLRVITSGPIPPDPVELLSGEKMAKLLEQANQHYDHIIIDGPPVLGLADALILANLAEATLVTVEAGKTRKATLLDSLKRLERANANLLGTIISRVSRATNPDYDQQYYYTYMASPPKKAANVRSL